MPTTLRIIVTGCALLTACAPEPSTAPTDQGPSFVISDGAHSGGNEHFYFLPPMVSSPGYGGTFDGTLTPQVRITGPGGFALLLTSIVSPSDELYHANWNTQGQGLAAGEEYRIAVQVDGTTLGFADVVIGANMSELRNVNTGEYIPLKDGRTLPIKFRIEEGALADQWIQVSAGDFTSCALSRGGEVYCWGRNTFGQLGDGTTEDRWTPVRLNSGVRFSQISVGFEHVCGLATDRAIYCWGRNGGGELGNGRYGPYDHSLSAERVNSELEWRYVESGASHTCALAVDGFTYCWGNNDIGQLGNRTNLDPVYPSTTPVPVLNSAFTKLNSSVSGACGIASDGTGHCWGAGYWGRNGNGSNADQPSPVPVSGGHVWQYISTAHGHTCGLTLTSETYCWGSNGTGQLGIGDPSSTPSYSPTPVQTSGIVFKQVEVGGHSCAITEEGLAYCWGYGYWGQLGFGGSTYRVNSPVAVGGGLRFLQISPGTEHTCALTLEREIYCWGRNQFGELGDGTTTPAVAPVRVSFSQ